VITEEEIRERTQTVLDEFGQTNDADLRGHMFDAGLAMVNFPEGKGGLGISPGLQTAVEETIRGAGRDISPFSVNPIGVGMGMPTVMTYGSEDHHAKHLRRMYTGEDIWCQMFSEPTHGSDVAGLASRAVRDGDEWVVNGQKVWTSLAHLSSYGMLLVRTDPDVPKHRGLSYFILDMSTPGIEIRPLFQLTGDAEFNEIFFTDVRVPHSALLGEVGDGWRVATTTLMNERVALGGSTAPRGAGLIASLVTLWDERAPELPEAERVATRDRVSQLWIEAEILRLTTLRARASSTVGTPGPEGSVGKLASAELNQRIYEAIIDLLGAEGMLHEPGYPRARSEGGEGSAGTSASGRFLRSRANTIEGGTSEIMRNILGERVLGLPGDVRVDKEVPWREIPA
jgi:alkylation response protein AidB-like acyl-CoA dehydrogenase